LKRLNCLLIIFTIALLAIYSCSKEDDKSNFDSKNYPEEVGRIMVEKCATAGCHNEQSKLAAGGLSLSSWDQLFEGSRAGSSVIPYRADQSYLLFSINTYPSLGVTLSPTMPFNDNPLSSEEYTVIKDWIIAGAPNKDGVVKFSNDPERRKIYVANQGCDMIAVFDANSKILMRYIDVGSKEEIELPRQVKVAPNGKYWYSIFFSNSIIQKYDAMDDQLIGEVELGIGNWNSFSISSDSKYGYIINWSDNGSIAIVDLETMQLANKYEGSGLFELPFGSFVNGSNNMLYVTAQHGNFIYKVDITNQDIPIIEKVSLNGVSPTTISWLNPSKIVMSPDESNYLVTCEESNEVRILSTEDDSLIAIIPTGNLPQEMAVSQSSPYVFVTCTEDISSFPGKTGSVHIIDYSNHTLVKTLHTGYQPHGIVVDDKEQLVYVAHRNMNSDGPAPHHQTDCDGRNGYVAIIDLNTLELLPDYKVEVSVDPYSVSLRD